MTFSPTRRGLSMRNLGGVRACFAMRQMSVFQYVMIICKINIPWTLSNIKYF